MVGFDCPVTPNGGVGCDCPVFPNGEEVSWNWPVAPNGEGAGCDCPVFPNWDVVESVVVRPGLVADVVLVAGVDGFVNPNENLGVLSAGLGGSEAEVVLVVVGRLKARVGFVVLGAGAGVFAT